MSLDFIPIESYALYFYYAILFIVFINFLKLQGGFKQNDLGGFLFVIVLTLYVGFRPSSGQYFGDMATYKNIFVNFQNGESLRTTKDIFFNLFMKWCSSFMNVNFFFFICAILYIYPLYIVSKKWFKNYWFYSFLFLVASFSFWSYGTNGIRSGIAGSLFLLGISRDKRVYQIILIVLAINFHKTMLLPTLGFLLANIYNQPKKMIIFWLLCIPTSLILGSSFETMFASLGLFDDDRLSYLTDGNVNNDDFSSTGFRWDFLTYSGAAVFAGWYFIVKKKFEDKIYFWLFNIYVFSNAFWILVIRANFSNRFAYLSWFMMALIIVYPFLKKEMIDNQSKAFSRVLVLYFLFTFVMNVLLVK